MSVISGGIGDDVTGTSDLAGTLVRAARRAVQMIGVPAGPAEAGEPPAGVGKP